MKLPEKKFLQFVDTVGRRLFKPDLKFLRSALFGLVMGKSTLLSEIGRALDRGDLQVTENYLSRHMQSDRFRDEAVEADYLALVAEPHLHDPAHPVPNISIDVTDIVKPRARVMPYLSSVHDGSKDEIAEGWYVMAVEAVWPGGRRLPLCSRLYSHEHPDYRSPAVQVAEAIALVRPHVPAAALWSFDSGFEGRRCLEAFHEADIDFVVRLYLPGIDPQPHPLHKRHGGGRKRNIWIGDKKHRLQDLVSTLETKMQFLIRRFQGDKRKRDVWTARVGWVSEVQLQNYNEAGVASGPDDRTYSLLVVRRAEKPPMVLLTNVPVRNAWDAQRVVNAYFDRWAIEEKFRFTKCYRQGLDLEDVRLQSWTGLRRMVLMVMLAYGFLASLVCGAKGLAERVARKAQAFGELPRYLVYRLAQGLRRVLRDVTDHPLPPRTPWWHAEGLS